MREFLQNALPAGRVLTDPNAMQNYLRDEADWAPNGIPIAVVRPRSTQEVQTIVRACIEHDTPVVPRGAGTGLCGGANATNGSVVLSLDQMHKILLIDKQERTAVVQPGVINNDLRTAVEKQGLWYPPDPASATWSSIGGNVATNAGGICCVKYGVTRDYVLQLELVTGTGEIVRVGRKTAKSSAGYDLCGLMVGSEGTLGIITEITVRLRPTRPPERTVAGHFASITEAGEAVRLITSSNCTPSALELIDKHCLIAVDDWKHMGLSAEAEVVLLGKTDAPGSEGQREAETLLHCFETAGAVMATIAEDEQEAEMLFAARVLAYPAIERFGPVMTEDVCVPLANVPEMLDRIEKTGIENNIQIANIAHAGDGNLHPLILVDKDDQELIVRAELAFDKIMRDAISLGGTVSGEHGIGLLKKHGLSMEHSPELLRMQHAVKIALDPHGILNPGKALPELAS